MISVIITSYDEGDKVAATVASVVANTSDVEVIVVDDGSTDGSCDDCGATQVLRYNTRRGIAQSRLDGVAAASGDCYAFLDAHQSVTEGCFDKLAQVARGRNAIVVPCTRGPVDRRIRRGVWTGHGSAIAQQRDNGLFKGRWRNYDQKDPLSRCSMMVVPGYVIPKTVFPSVRWNDGARSWGGSEPNVAVKAFFADIDILHLCGPIARHEFRGKRRENGRKVIERPFRAAWRDTWRNHARTARICFEESTWRDYWWPSVYSRWGKSPDEFDSPDVMSQHNEFQKIKQRPDDEFWRGLLLAERYDYRQHG